MYSMKDAESIIKYCILTTWLVERLENNEKIEREELKRLLSSLDILIEEKVCDKAIGDTNVKGSDK